MVGIVAVDSAVTFMVVTVPCGFQFLMEPPFSCLACTKFVQAILEPRLSLHLSRMQPRPHCLKAHALAWECCFCRYNKCTVYNTFVCIIVRIPQALSLLFLPYKTELHLAIYRLMFPVLCCQVSSTVLMHTCTHTFVSHILF